MFTQMVKSIFRRTRRRPQVLQPLLAFPTAAAARVPLLAYLQPVWPNKLLLGGYSRGADQTAVSKTSSSKISISKGHDGKCNSDLTGMTRCQ